MTRCPIHDRPLVTEHTSRKKICIACFTERMRRQRSERIVMTNEKHAGANNARAKKAYHDKKAAK
jgi:hypothetical protein